MISTRGRYSVRILLELAGRPAGEFIPLKELAASQEISLKYVERIMPPLKVAGLVETTHGIGGGYRLAVSPDSCTIWDILKVAEGSMAPVACLENGAEPCPRAAECRTLPVWKGYYDLTKGYFSSLTLSDVMKAPEGGSYVI